MENYFCLDYVIQLKHLTKLFRIAHWKFNKAAYKQLTYFGMIHFQYHWAKSLHLIMGKAAICRFPVS